MRSMGKRRRSSPGLPRRLATLPQTLEQTKLTDRVHALPEVLVAVSHELSITCEALEPIALEHGLITVDVLQDTRLEDHESTVDPSLADLRFFGELLDAVAVEDEPTEAR